jgi:hypothetical protein
MRRRDSHSAGRRGSAERWPFVALALVLLVTIIAVVLRERWSPPQRIRVAVLNGCGVSGVASRFSELLVSKGFDVIKTGNAESFNFVESIIVDRSGSYAAAEKVASALRIKNCIQQIEEDRVEQVAVVIGRDYREILERHK